MESKTETKEAPPIIGVAVGDKAATLELVRPQIQEVVWTKERVEVLKRQSCPPDITEDEFFVFLEQCKRSGLDPLLGQADCISRGSFQDVRGEDGKPQWKNGEKVQKWVEKKVFSPREAGMRARADLFPDYRGISSATVREGDEFRILKGEKKVVHNFNPADPARMKKPIMGAWAQIYREGRTCDVRWVPLSERIGVKKNGEANVFWSTKAETMMDKCARAEAYRLEYPGPFSGQYIREETEAFEERELNDPPTGPIKPPEEKKSRTDDLEEKVKAEKAKSDAKQKPAGQQTVDAAPAAKPEEKKTEAAKPPSGPILAFGPVELKGQAIRSLSGAQIQAMIDMGTEQVAKHPGASWAGKVSGCVADLKAEVEDRLKIASQEREPGDDQDPPMP